MIIVRFNFSEQCYDYGINSVRISPDEHNNFYLDPVSNSIKLHTIPVAVNNENTPGNGIDGQVDQPIPIIRMNNSVSRKVAGDPTASNEGVILPDLLNAYFDSLGV